MIDCYIIFFFVKSVGCGYEYIKASSGSRSKATKLLKIQSWRQFTGSLKASENAEDKRRGMIFDHERIDIHVARTM